MKILLFLQLLLIPYLGFGQGILLNEVLTSNINSANDEEGDNPDWIELYNPTNNPVNLAGYGLSDNVNKPFKWTFEEYTMSPGEYLLVFASGKNRQGGFVQPTEVSGLMAWFHAQNIDAENSDQVVKREGVSQIKKWVSHDGRYTLAQSNEKVQPSLVNNAINGVSGVRFDGAGDFLKGDFSPPVGNKARTVIVMIANAKLDELNQAWDNYILGYGSYTESYGISFRKKLQNNAIGTEYRSGSFYGHGKLSEEPTFISEVYTGEINTFFVNGTFSGQQLIAFNTGDEFPLVVGAGLSGYTGFFGGDILDILIFDKALSTDERRRVENYLAQTYALQTQLFHTNFSLSASGETVLLTSPEGNQVDRMDVPELSPNQSYGIIGNGYACFEVPTPGAVNDSKPAEGQLEAPVFSHFAGFYKTDFLLSLQSPDPDALILYTLDGSIPDPHNTDGLEYRVKYDYQSNDFTTFKSVTYTYKEPISISSTGNNKVQRNKVTSSYVEWFPEKYKPTQNAMIVRAVCVKEGALKSKVLTQTYLVDPQGSFNPTLPVVSVVTPDTALFKYETGIYVPGIIYDETKNESNPDGNYRQSKWERPAHLELFDKNGNLIYQQQAGVRIHGNFSAHRPRKSLRLEAKKKYGGESLFNYPLFPHLYLNPKVGTDRINEYNAFLLRNSGNNSNSCLFQDVMVHTLISHLNTHVQASRAVHHFLNGEYWGIMNMREHFDEQYFASHFQMDVNDVIIANLRTKEIKAGYEYEYQELTDLDRYINHSEDPLSAYEHIASKMEIENYLTHFVVNVYINGRDFLENNKKMWKKRSSLFTDNTPYGHDGRWRWIFYDADQSLTQPEQNTLEYTLASNTFSTRILFAILETEQGKNEFINLFCDNMNSTFQAERSLAVLDSLKAEMDPDIQMHINRWGTNLADQKYSDFVEFFRNRPSAMRKHLREAFSLTDSVMIQLDTDFEQGIITINSLKIDSSTIGLDDPQNPYPWKGYYFKEIPVRLVATPRRGYVFSHWSNQNTSDTIYVTANSDQKIVAYFKPISTAERDVLIINEINYHSSDEWNAGDWVEFYNPQNYAVDISGWVFKDDNDSHTYIFPAETFVPAMGYLVLCQKYDSFQEVYPTVSNYRGNMSFGLGNKSDRLRLFDNTGLLVDEVEYANQSPWPAGTDATGCTLELIRPGYDNSLASSWQCSPLGGTPGRANSWAVHLDQVKEEAAKLVFYPNPCTDNLTLEFPVEKRGEIVTIQLFNLLGQSLYTQQSIVLPTVQLNTSTLPTGNYILSVRGENNFQSRFVFIKK